MSTVEQAAREFRDSEFNLAGERAPLYAGFLAGAAWAVDSRQNPFHAIPTEAREALADWLEAKYGGIDPSHSMSAVDLALVQAGANESLPALAAALRGGHDA